MPQDNFKTDRAYFWSNSYVHPKAKSKFLVEFGSGIFNTNFNGKYDWLVKAVNRPKYTAEYEDFKNTISYATTSVLPKSWNWEPVTIKFVNPFSLTFWPRDLTQDLDEMLSNLAQSMIARENPKKKESTTYFSAKVVEAEQETLSPIVQSYFGSSIKLHDVSMGFQSPKLGTGGDQDSNINGVTQYNDTNNPTIRSEELKLGKMYSNGYWELYNPWITKLDFGDFDYSVDEFIEISITFKYQNAVYFSKLREDQFGNDVFNQALRLPPSEPSDKQRMKNIERDVAVARNSGLLQFLENSNDEVTKMLNATSPQFKGTLTNPVSKSPYSTFYSNRTLALQYEADKIIVDPKKAK